MPFKGEASEPLPTPMEACLCNFLEELADIVAEANLAVLAFEPPKTVYEDVGSGVLTIEKDEVEEVVRIRLLLALGARKEDGPELVAGRDCLDDPEGSTTTSGTG